MASLKDEHAYLDADRFHSATFFAFFRHSPWFWYSTKYLC